MDRLGAVEMADSHAETFTAEKGFEHLPGQHLPGRGLDTAGETPAAPGEDEQAKENGKENNDDEDNGADQEEEENGLSARSHSQTEATLEWLEKNYEHADEVCLPRCVLYGNYLTHCRETGFSPAGAAAFGKLIRQRFPKITTRRLGTRGQSKYHYYGIGIKVSSSYYQAAYSGKGLTRFSATKVKTKESGRKYCLRSKVGTLLPDLPTADDLVLRPDICKDKVDTFCLMYHTHCQRVLDTVISANFEEVQSFLLHFWQGMPSHLEELLTEQVVDDLVGLCDSVLYRVLADVLIPTTIQDLPDNICSEIRIFVHHIPMWLKSALEYIPENITKKKMEAAHHFTQNIQRQISFIQLAQTSRTVLQCSDTLDRMLHDLDLLEFDRLSLQVATLKRDCIKLATAMVRKYFDEFRHLLKTQSSIEVFIEWIDTMVDTRVLQGSLPTGSSHQNDAAHRKLFQSKAASFLLHWSIFSSFILRDLTLSSAHSFGSFHVLYMTFNEYIFLIMETQLANFRDVQNKRHVTSFIRNPDELCLQARQTPPGRSLASPLTKKRREDRDQSTATVPSIDDDNQRQSTLPSPPTAPDKGHMTTNQDGGAPSLPMPPKDVTIITQLPVSYPEVTTTREQCLHPIPVALLKPTPSTGVSIGVGYALPVQGGLATYSQDYHQVRIAQLSTAVPLPQCPSQAYSSTDSNDSQPHTQNGFVQLPTTNGFTSCSIGSAYTPSTVASSYWTEEGGGRGNGVTMGENYTVHAGYDGKYAASQYEQVYHVPRGTNHYNNPVRSTLYANHPTTDAISGAPFGMSPYGGNMNYLDHVVPPCGQFRQDSLLGNLHQVESQEFFPAGFPGAMTSRNKPFITPFR